MNVIYPRTRTVFLAGTIDNGDSTNWQEELIDMCQYKNIVFFNPRRKDWLGEFSKEELEYQIKLDYMHNLESFLYSVTKLFIDMIM